MTILTLPQIIALQKHEPVSAVSGNVKFVFAVKEAPDHRNPGKTVEIQRVVLTDGVNDLWCVLFIPSECGGIIPENLKDQRLYLWSNDKGKGLKRGGSVESSDPRKRGVLLHYLEITTGASWGTQDPTPPPPPPKGKPKAAPAPPVEEGFDFEATPAPVAASALKTAPPAAPKAAPVTKANPVQQPEEEAFETGSTQAPMKEPVKQTPPATPSTFPPALAVLVLQHRQAVEGAIDTANATQAAIGVTGGGWSDVAIAKMAGDIFREAVQKGVWK